MFNLDFLHAFLRCFWTFHDRRSTQRQRTVTFRTREGLISVNEKSRTIKNTNNIYLYEYLKEVKVKGFGKTFRPPNIPPTPPPLEQKRDFAIENECDLGFVLPVLEILEFRITNLSRSRLPPQVRLNTDVVRDPSTLMSSVTG